MSPKKHFEVMMRSHPDYDFTTFCYDCNLEALECAKEHLEREWDALDEWFISTTVRMLLVDGDPDVCYGKNCKREDLKLNKEE